MCKIDNCLRTPKSGADGYCPRHAPKPWHVNAVALYEKEKSVKKNSNSKRKSRLHLLKIEDQEEAEILQKRARDVFGNPGTPIPLSVVE